MTEPSDRMVEGFVRREFWLRNGTEHPVVAAFNFPCPRCGRESVMQTLDMSHIQQEAPPRRRYCVMTKRCGWSEELTD